MEGVTLFIAIGIVVSLLPFFMLLSIAMSLTIIKEKLDHIADILKVGLEVSEGKDSEQMEKMVDEMHGEGE